MYRIVNTLELVNKHTLSVFVFIRGRRLILITADFPPSIKNSSFSTFITSTDL